MKAQQTSSQEAHLRRDATAATEGHSFHAAAAAVAVHQDQEATSPVWV